MNKLLWLLLMPFFIGCSNHAADKDNVVTTLKRLVQERKLDSLAITGKTYIWQGSFGESGFKDYILLNRQISDSVEKFIDTVPERKNAQNIFLENIIQNENGLSRDSSMCKMLVDVLYKHALNIFSSTSSYDERVVTDYEKCVLFQEKWKLLDSSDYFYACRDLGIQYNKLGEKEKAAKYYSKAINYYNRNVNLPAKRVNKIASAFINSLGFFNEYKLYDSVIVNAKTLLELDSIETQKTAQIRAAYAEALYAKNDEAYRQQLEMALDSLEKIPDSVMNSDILGKRSDVLKLKGEIALKQHNYEAAAFFLRKSLDTCLKKNKANRHERSYAKLLLQIANVFDSTRQYDSALYYCQQALACVTRVDSADMLSNPKPEELYTENTIMEALDAKARLLYKKYEQQKDVRLLENAVDCYDLAFSVERKLTDNFTYDTSRAEMQKQSKIRSSAAIKNCYTLYGITKDNKWAEMAFQFSENSKALLLLESVKKNIFYNQYLKENPLLKKFDSLKLLRAYAEKQLQENQKNVTDTALVNRKAILDKEIDNAQEALEVANLSARNLRQQVQPELLPELRKNLLTENRSLVEFFSDSLSNYVFIVNRSAGIGFYQIDSAAITSVDSLLKFFDNSANISNNPIGYKLAAYNIYKSAHLQQVPSAITSILIIPDGAFNQLPFDALLTESDPSTGFKNTPYLLNRFTTSYGYSAASLLQQYGNNSSKNNTLAAFAPVFEQQQRKLPTLRNTRDEVKAIGADRNNVYTDDKATVANFRYSLTHAGMIHIATHAGIDTSETNPRLEFADSLFETNELYALRLNNNLVMLNACQTNKGKIDESEGALSLARGFYYAGAKNVVASLWNVDDLSGAKIAENFYRQAKNNGHNFGAALHQAKKDFLADNPGGTKYSPYYWAALMHIGGPEKPQGASGIILYGAVTGVVLFLLMFFIAWKRKKAYSVNINQPAVSRLARTRKKAE